MATKAHSGVIRPYAPALVELGRVIDAGLILLAMLIACDSRRMAWDNFHTILSLLALAIFSISSSYLGLYRSWRVTPLRGELWRVLLSWMITVLVVVFLAYTMHSLPPDQHMLVLAWLALGAVLLSLMRIFVRGGLRWLRVRGRNFRTAAIIGATNMGARVNQSIQHTAWLGIKVIGCYDDRKPHFQRTHLGGPEVVGDVSELLRKASAGEVDIIFIALPMSAERRIKNFLDCLGDSTASVYLVPDFSSFDLLHSRWDMLGTIPMVSVVDTPEHGLNSVLKRSFDIFLATAILTALAIPMLAIALAIRLTSPGPAIYKQQRYGLNGKKFEIWKFRSMSVCEQAEQYTQATRNDSRVTPLGAFLRKTSLDELPQFINVLQGTMSIVGPRPHPVAMNEQQRKLINRYMLRYKVKPGITGWAQVNGYRGETDSKDKISGRIQRDLEYIDNWSLWLDIKIIFRTLRTVFGDVNAY